MRQRDVVAFHEAGHAVAMCVLGREVKQVSVLAMAGTAGRVIAVESSPPGDVLSLITGGSRSLYDDDEWADVVQWVSGEVIISLAGPVAEQRVTGKWNQAGAMSDLEKVAEVLVSTLAHDDDRWAPTTRLGWVDHEALLRTARDEFDGPTRALLDEHWAWVEAVASDVSVRNEISGARVLELRPSSSTS